MLWHKTQGAGFGAAVSTAIEDVFSTYLYTGNGSTQTITNGIDLGQSNASGSVFFGGTATGEHILTNTSSDFQLGANDFTVELFMNVTSSAGDNQEPFSFGDGNGAFDFLVYFSGTQIQLYASTSGSSWNLLSGVAAGTFTVGKWHHFAITRSGENFRAFLDGVQTANFTASGSIFQSANSIAIGKGQSSKRFNGYMSNFHFVNGTAIYTSAFTPPKADLLASANSKLLAFQSPNFFTDNSGASNTLTQVGTVNTSTSGPFYVGGEDKGGLVWMKDRLSTSLGFHVIYDTENGTGPNGGRIFGGTASTNGTSTQSDGLQSFNSDGFTLGSNTYENGSGKSFASWTFRKAERFFDVVTYTGNGQLYRNIAHNLGVAPGAIFVKRTDAAQDWLVYHRSPGATQYGILNSTSQFGSGFAAWSNTEPTSSVFTVGSYAEVNASGVTYVAYLFAHDPLGPSGDGSDGLIACGSTNGTKVTLGWEPQWILHKSSNFANDWSILDVQRGMPWGAQAQELEANTSDAEALSRDDLNVQNYSPKIYADGFELGAIVGSHIYIAIRRGPMREPTSGTEVFDLTLTENASEPFVTSAFPVDTGLVGYRSGGGFYWGDRLRGSNELVPSSTAAEAGGPMWQWDYQNGWLGSASGANLFYSLRRAPGFFDVVAYTGTGVARTISHNLNVAPEMMIVKGRTNLQNWPVYAAPLGNSTVAFLNLNNAVFTGIGHWNSTTPTSSVFSLGDSVSVNQSGVNFIAYLFATLPGISKVGSYTGNGSSQTINCGFTGGARFVLIKRADSTGDWYVWDTARGIVTGNDPFLELNTTDAEVTSDDSIDPASSGFIVNQVAATNINVSSASYIFYAIS